jgi:hypothetical protein
VGSAWESLHGACAVTLCITRTRSTQVLTPPTARTGSPAGTEDGAGKAVALARDAWTGKTSSHLHAPATGLSEKP